MINLHVNFIYLTFTGFIQLLKLSINIFLQVWKFLAIISWIIASSPFSYSFPFGTLISCILDLFILSPISLNSSFLFPISSSLCCIHLVHWFSLLLCLICYYTHPLSVYFNYYDFISKYNISFFLESKFLFLFFNIFLFPEDIVFLLLSNSKHHCFIFCIWLFQYLKSCRSVSAVSSGSHFWSLASLCTQLFFCSFSLENYFW